MEVINNNNIEYMEEGEIEGKFMDGGNNPKNGEMTKINKWKK